MNYVETFTQTARLVWRTRALWALGMLAALFGQSEYRFSANYSQSGSSLAPNASGDFPNPLAEGPLAAIAANPAPWIIGVVTLTLVFALLGLLVGWLAQGALISMVDTIERGGEASLGQSLRAAAGRLPALVLLAVLLALPLLLAVGGALAVLVPLIAQAVGSRELNPDTLRELLPQFLLTLACAFPLILLGALASLVLSLVNIVAARSCVIEGLGALASISRAWLLIRRNLADTLINWVVLGLCGAVFGVLAAIPALLLLIPTGQALLAGRWSALAAATGAGLVVYLLLMNVVVGGVLTSFNSAMWTRVYRTFAARTAG